MYHDDQDPFLPSNFHRLWSLYAHCHIHPQGSKITGEASAGAYILGSWVRRRQGPWTPGLGDPPNFWDPEEQGARTPRSPSQALPPGTFTYLPRCVNTVPSFLFGPPRPAAASCERRQVRGEGKGRRGCLAQLPLSVIGQIPVSGRGAGFATTCPGRNSGKGQSI